MREEEAEKAGQAANISKKEVTKPEVIPVTVTHLKHDENEEKEENYIPQPSEMLRRSSETLAVTSSAREMSSDEAPGGPHEMKHILPRKIVGQDFHTIISPTGPPMVTSAEILHSERRESITSADIHFPLPEPKPHQPPSLAATIARASVEARLRDKGYQLGKLLGEGSYAKVYLTDYWNPNPNPPDVAVEKEVLACKVIDESHASKNFLARFLPREITMLLRVNHHNVVRIHSMLKIARKFFFFMHFCENGDILHFIREHGVIREEQAKIWFSEMLDGLEYLHENHIAHRDLKCENILLDKGFHIRIGDFGFARLYLPGEEKSRTFCGSLSYAPPEVIHGDPYNPLLGDLWSIGIVLFIMLNKAMPFDDSGTRKMYESQMNRTWKFRHKIEDTLSIAVKEFIYLLLEPQERKRKSIPQIRREAWLLTRRGSLAAPTDGGRRRSTLPRIPPLYSY